MVRCRTVLYGSIRIILSEASRSNRRYAPHSYPLSSCVHKLLKENLSIRVIMIVFVVMCLYIAPARTLTSFRFRCYAHCRSCLLLAKAVSSCNNCGEQRCRDNLTAAIVVSTIQKTVKRRFFQKRVALPPSCKLSGAFRKLMSVS